ncbi:unannotated protein [freshwater metagenome]|uniref:Unannotated protein n=1 Tax=freshwater metagenome TaxID=449393 RepID=A0A6J7DIQ1_9ZZZZ
MPEGIHAAAAGRHVAARGPRPLACDHDREAASAGMARPQPVADLFEIERPLRDEDRVGAARHPRMAGDPSGVAAHHLDDEHPVVGLGRGVEAVDRVGGDLDGGVEAEGVVGPGEIVVDRLRDAHHRDAVVGESRGDAERVLAADRDQRLDARALHRAPDDGGSVGSVPVGVGAGGAENRPAAVDQPRSAVDRQLDHVVVDESGPAVAHADELVAVVLRAPAHDRAQDGIEAGTVAAAGEQTDAHRPIVARAGRADPVVS